MNLKCRYGDFEIKAEPDLISDSLMKYGEWAQSEIDVLSCFINRGDTIVDAGAYIGTHSRAFSAMVGETGCVFAFEPNESTFSVLASNVALAPTRNIQIFPFGLGSVEEKRNFFIAIGASNAGATRLVENSTEGTQHSVEIRTLDSLHLTNVRFIKADVEDMELEVLKGAVLTIKASQPVIFIEVNSLQASHGVFQWAKQENYVAYGLVSAAFNADNFNQVAENIFGIAQEVGLILIHRDSQARYSDDIKKNLLPYIETIDDLAVLMFYKPQYTTEILAKSDVVSKLGGNYSPSELETSRSRIAELEGALEASARAQMDAERLAFERQDLIAEANARIKDVEEVKDIAEKLAFERLDALTAMSQQLVLTSDAKQHAEELALARGIELENLRTNKNKSMELPTEPAALGDMVKQSDTQIVMASQKSAKKRLSIWARINKLFDTPAK